MAKSSDGASSSNSDSLAQRKKISAAEVAKLKKAIYGAAGTMSGSVQDEDVIICLGSTRGGKSTIVNQLIGNPLAVVDDPDEDKVYLVKAAADPSNQQGPAIGNSSTSETVLPSRWLSKKPGKIMDGVLIQSPLHGKVVWDAPGFDDSRGEIQDITNAFYIKSLLRGVKSAKLVLVSDYKEISGDNISHFTKLLTSVQRVFKENTKDISNSISLIFTKVPFYNGKRPIEKTSLCKMLERKIVESTSNIDQDCRYIIKSLISHPNRIAIFREADSDTKISDLEEGIDSAIESSMGLDKSFLSAVSPSVSADAANFLRSVSDQLSKEVGTQIKKLLDDIEKGYKVEIERIKKDVEKKPKEEVGKIRDDLKEKIGAIKVIIAKPTPDQASSSTSTSSNPQIEKEISLTNKLIAIKGANEGAGKLIEELKINDIVGFLEFLDGLLEINTCSAIYYEVVKSAIDNIITGFEQLTVNLAEKIGEITKAEMEEQINKLKQQNEDQQKRNLDEAAKIQQSNDEKNQKGLEKAFGDFAQAGGKLIGKGADLLIEGVAKVVPGYIEKKVQESCTIQLLSDIEYDNPLLNDSSFLQLFTKTYGMSATSRLIDLTTVLTEDHREELKEIVSDPGAIEILGNLIGEQYDFS